MRPASTKATGIGGRRVYHVGNAVLSVLVFGVTLVLSMALLDPRRGSGLLPERFQVPPVGFTEGVLVKDFTAVVVRANQSTLLMVPAAGIRGVEYVSRALDNFFSVALATANDTNAVGQNDVEGAGMRSQFMVTLADVYSTVLLRGGSADASKTPAETTGAATTAPLSLRRPSVLHLCSALACVAPFVAQQWSDRAEAASLLNDIKHNRSSTLRTRARAVTNLALVFGEASESVAVMHELAEHRVLTAQISATSHDYLSAMPLIGKLALENVQAACSSLKECHYRCPVKHAQVATGLKAQSEHLPAEASRKRLLEEWLRRNATSSGSSAWRTVDVLPFALVVFEDSRKLDEVPLDLVHVDLSSADSVAALAYLEALVSATVKPPHLPPRNLLVSIFASEWVKEIIDMLLRLETVHRYSAIPLQKSCIGPERAFTPHERWSMSHMQSWMRESSLEGAYLSPFLGRSRAAQIPLCTVLLSRQVDSLDKLLQMVSKVISTYPSAASPLERFLYHSVGLSPNDEELVTSLPSSLADAKVSSVSSSSRALRGAMEFAVQHSYCVIPIAVCFLLTRNVCRRRGVCE
ncbi:hypothetical protein LSCM1_00111 [Leishmania martiniquensis]|uniref:Uncharacterized protein n=1 Tax=Leishmania martiniquensis TaxID=1580590 RepID=A0A836GHD6_9TRYP|nr:hypothetical protein LSCM1_00111 [Leishmania martiniquensis]